ncbi:Protein of unknown function [Bacillus wiedmannii]|nr:Protein of unknown function [Bacillus wiedmannii]
MAVKRENERVVLAKQ